MSDPFYILKRAQKEAIQAVFEKYNFIDEDFEKISVGAQHFYKFKQQPRLYFLFEQLQNNHERFITICTQFTPLFTPKEYRHETTGAVLNVKIDGAIERFEYWLKSDLIPFVNETSNVLKEREDSKKVVQKVKDDSAPNLGIPSENYPNVNQEALAQFEALSKEIEAGLIQDNFATNPTITKLTIEKTERLVSRYYKEVHNDFYLSYSKALGRIKKLPFSNNILFNDLRTIVQEIIEDFKLRVKTKPLDWLKGTPTNPTKEEKFSLMEKELVTLRKQNTDYRNESWARKDNDKTALVKSEGLYKKLFYWSILVLSSVINFGLIFVFQSRLVINLIAEGFLIVLFVIFYATTISDKMKILITIALGILTFFLNKYY